MLASFIVIPLTRVDRDPDEVRVLKGVPLLDSAAVAAVREWRWRPYLLLERPVPFWVTVTVNFRLA